MDRGSVLSGGAFRAAVYATTIFLATSLAVALAGYRFIQLSQIDAIRDEGNVIVQMLTRLLEEEGQDAFLGQADRMIWRPGPGTRFVSVYDGEWKPMAGAIDPAALADGSRSFVSFEDEAGDTRDFYVLRTTIGAFPVLVGIDLAIVARIESVFLRTLLAIAFVMTLVFIALGYLASRAAQRKLDAMGAVLDQVADGNMEARIPVHASNDQIDRIASRINGQLDRLSVLQAARSNSAAAVAHDLKRPLGRAMLRVDQAVAAADGEAVAIDVVEDLREDLVRLGSVFDSVLRIARIGAAWGERLRDRVSLHALVQDLGETYQVVAEETGRRLDLDPGPADLTVMGDAGMLTQMLANLLQNAVTHGPAGNRVTLTARREDAGAVLEVADTGPGIPQDDIDRVVAPFARRDTARTTEGNGLGLTLVKAVADRHCAALDLTDAKPGLRVTVTFPAVWTR